MKFNELNLKKEIIFALEQNNFIEATEIQSKAIPIFLEGKSIFAQSSTGTGKTAAFVLPILEKIEPDNRNTQAIIMAPTRELALQIYDVIRKFSRNIKNVWSTLVVGGASIRDQQRQLRNSQIVIATPGRIKDHIDRKNINLSFIKTIILDEADEMLKMGFKQEIDSVFTNIKQKTQVGLFSATTNKKVLEIAEKYMNDYELIKIDNQISVNENITNSFVYTRGIDKEALILEVYKKHKPAKSIIFTNTKNNTDRIQKNLKSIGIDALVINGDKKQSQRTRSIKMFKNGERDVLVATDVAARGLDANGVDYVINYDISMEDEHFVHRIGRTGRNSNKGNSISFVNNSNTLNQLKGIQRKYKIIIDETHPSEYNLIPKDRPERSESRPRYKSKSYGFGNSNDKGSFGSKGKGFSKRNNDNRSFKKKDTKKHNHNSTSMGFESKSRTKFKRQSDFS